jgi:hypothetical protein
MMTDEQKSKIAELKAAIAVSSPTTGGAPEAVRSAALALKKELRWAGTTARVLALALGVHESTLCRWEQDGSAKHGVVSQRQRGGPGARFRLVQVTAPATTPALAVSARSTARGLRVAHAPSGLVIDGLDVETLAALLRRMA